MKNLILATAFVSLIVTSAFAQTAPQTSTLTPEDTQTALNSLVSNIQQLSSEKAQLIAQLAITNAHLQTAILVNITSL